MSKESRSWFKKNRDAIIQRVRYPHVIAPHNAGTRTWEPLLDADIPLSFSERQERWRSLLDLMEKSSLEVSPGMEVKT